MKLLTELAAVLCLVAAPGVAVAQGGPVPVEPGPDGFTVADRPRFLQPETTLALSAVSLSVIGLALSVDGPTPATRTRGGVGMVTGLFAVGAGIVLAGREDQSMGMMIGGLGVVTMYHANQHLHRAQRQRVGVAPLVTMGRQPSIGLTLSLNF